MLFSTCLFCWYVNLTICSFSFFSHVRQRKASPKKKKVNNIDSKSLVEVALFEEKKMSEEKKVLKLYKRKKNSMTEPKQLITITIFN